MVFSGTDDHFHIRHLSNFFMINIIFIFCTLYSVTRATEVAQADLELRARVIRDVAEHCIDQLEERILALELLSVDSTSTENRFIVEAGYHKDIAAGKVSLSEIKAYNPSNSDLNLFSSQTMELVSQSRALVRSLLERCPSDTPILGKECHLLDALRVSWVDLEVATRDLEWDLKYMNHPERTASILDAMLEQLVTAYEQVVQYVETVRGLDEVRNSDKADKFVQIDEFLPELWHYFTRLRSETVWPQMPVEARFNGVDSLHTALRQSMINFAKDVAVAEIKLAAVDTLASQDQQLSIMASLNLVRERLRQMTPVSPNHIADLIQYVEDYQREAIPIK